MTNLLGGSEPLCGRPQGECCLPLHEAAQAITRERRVAHLVPDVVAFVAAHPGCSARKIYTELAGMGRQRIIDALDLAVSRGQLRREWVGPRRQRLWLAEGSGASG